MHLGRNLALAAIGSAGLLVGCVAIPAPTSSPALSGSVAPTLASDSGQPPSAVVLTRIPVPDPRVDTNPPDPVLAAGGAIWIIQGREQCCRLVRVDPVTDVVKILAPAIDLGAMVGDDGSLWVAATSGGRSITSEALSRVDETTGAFTSVPTPSLPGGRSGAEAVGLGSIWISTEAAPLWGMKNLLVRLDETTGREMKRWPIGLGDLQVACGAVWGTSLQADGVTRDLVRFDPSSGALTPIGGEAPLIATPGGCWHWVSDGFQRVWPPPAFTTITPQKGNLQFDGTSFWDWPGRYLQRWDPLTGRDLGPTWVVATSDLGGDAYEVPASPDESRIVAAGGAIWLVNRTELVRFDIPAGT